MIGRFQFFEFTEFGNIDCDRAFGAFDRAARMSSFDGQFMIALAGKKVALRHFYVLAFKQGSEGLR